MACEQGGQLEGEHIKNVRQRIEKDIFPILGKYPITEIEAPQMLNAVRQIEKRGALEMARRCAQFSG